MVKNWINEYQLSYIIISKKLEWPEMNNFISGKSLWDQLL